MFQAQGAKSKQWPPPLPPTQKAICYNSGGLTKPEMDAAPQNLYHPKGNCLLNHREPGESGGRVQGHRDTPEEKTVEEGVSSCHSYRHHPNPREVSDRWEEMQNALALAGCAHACLTCVGVHTCTCTHKQMFPCPEPSETQSSSRQQPRS